MTEWFHQLHFARPFLLLMLLLIPVFWFRWRLRSPIVIVMRSLIFALLVLTLSDPAHVMEATAVVRAEIRTFAFDLSNSIPQAMRQWMEEVTSNRLSPGIKDRKVVFGGQFEVVEEWKDWLNGKKSLEPIKPDRTDLTSLLDNLAKDSRGSQSLYLLTDGWETKGSAEDIIPSLSASSLKVFPLLPEDPPEVANVRIKRIVAPRSAEGGEQAELRVTVDNQNIKDVLGKVILKRNGKVEKLTSVEVKPGSQIVSLKVALPDQGLTSFEVEFVAQIKREDLFLHDNSATAWIATSPGEKILLVNGQKEKGKILGEILKRVGFHVTSVIGDSLLPEPRDFKAVVLNEVPRTAFSTSYLNSLSEYVNRGGSLVMLGGEESFGPGGYQGSSVEAMLPVHLKEPVVEKKTRAIVLVIDKSGSMRGDKKLVYAKEAAKTLATTLKEHDLIGVVGFDVSPFVVIPLATLDRLRGVFADQVDRIKAGGRTFLYPAIVEARNQLEQKTATSKHIIILSDGETGGTGSDYIDLVTAMRRSSGIKVSTIAIGDQANIPLLRRIAQYGGGLYHHTYDPRTLPQIVLSKIQEKPAKDPPVKRDRIPVLNNESLVLRQFPFQPLPRLKGYVESEIKQGASLDVKVTDGSQEVPLMASWKYKRGKVVAFTADLHGRWTKHWIPWSGLEEYWRRTFRWLVPLKRPLPPHEVRINSHGSKSLLDLFLYGETGKTAVIRYSYEGNGGQGRGELARVSPGHYRTVLPFAAQGDYRIQLSLRSGKEERSFPLLGFTLPFDAKAEVPRDSFNVPLLQSLAERTGGSINPQPEEREATVAQSQTFQSWRTIPLLLAILLFLLETILSRWLPLWVDRRMSLETGAPRF
ncbi:MAG: VWA domain-containing protein [Deltaproteobacteria bacterium]|nr:VWA domain-containing protein [Deltaproteobacteria bacterium]